MFISTSLAAKMNVPDLMHIYVPDTERNNAFNTLPECWIASYVYDCAGERELNQSQLVPLSATLSVTLYLCVKTIFILCTLQFLSIYLAFKSFIMSV